MRSISWLKRSISRWSSNCDKKVYVETFKLNMRWSSNCGIRQICHSQGKRGKNCKKECLTKTNEQIWKRLNWTEHLKGGICKKWWWWTGLKGVTGNVWELNWKCSFVKNFLKFNWYLSDVFTVHTCSARVEFSLHLRFPHWIFWK